jgi:hypothetical protein
MGGIAMKMRDAKSATRKEAFELMVDLKQGRHLTPEQIGSLLRYLAPALPKRAKTAEQWVAKAVNPNEGRDYLRYVYVSNGVACGSDGYRVHRCRTTWPDGYYDPKTQLLVDFKPGDVGFPEVDRFFCRGGKGLVCGLEDLETGILAVGPGMWDALIEYERVPEGVAVNRKYFMDATNGAETGEIHDSGTRMHGMSEFGDWVIQEMRV